MNDEQMSREELLAEVSRLRRRVAEQEAAEIERGRVEEALRESEERLSTAGKAAYDLIYEWNVASDALEWFGDIDGLLGYKKGEISRDINAWLGLIHSEDMGKLENAVELHRTLTKPIQYEYRVRHRDGTYRYWNDHGLPLLDDKGHPYKWVGVCTDITERVQAEEALKASHARFLTVLDGIDAHIYVANLETYEILYMNKPMREDFGEDLVGEICWKVFRGQSAPCPHCTNDKLLDVNGNPTGVHSWEGQNPITGRWYMNLDRAIHWVDGRMVRLQVATDITERVQAEEALRESEFRFRTVSELTSDFAYAYRVGPDGDLDFLWTTGGIERLTGFTGDELHARGGWETLIFPDDMPIPLDQYHALMAGQKKAVEYRIVTKDGQIRWVRDYARPDWDESQERTVAIYGAMQDITERHLAEEALRESEEHLRLILENMPVLMDAFDQNITAIVWNKECKRVTGYSAEEVIGNPDMLELLMPDPEYRKRMMAEMVKRGNNYRDWEWEIVAKDGSRKTIAWSNISEAYPVPGWSGWGIGVDVTERVQAEQALREANERLEETLADLQSAQEQLVQHERLAAVGQMAAGIAHDFNNILAVIVLYTQIALRDITLHPELRERLQTIDLQAKRATDLIQQILDFSRRAVLKRQEMDLVPFLKEAVRLLERTLPENIQIEMMHGADPCTIYADPTRVQQVIMNLALNARDAMPGGGRLCIGLNRLTVQTDQTPPLPKMSPGDWVCLSVTDTGTGIAPDVLPHIFEPFFTTKLPHGSGLGLAQVYGIVRQHEGYVGVETEVGRGTIFSTYWPALAISEAPTAGQEIIGVSEGQHETILVVEDDDAMREALVDCLEMLNYGTLEAANGEEALRVLMRHRDDPATGPGHHIALVMSDWVMPTMSGKELVQQIKVRNLNVRVVIVTGYPLSDVVQDVDAEMVAGWVQKPPSLEQLADAVAQALGKS